MKADSRQNEFLFRNFDVLERQGIRSVIGRRA